MQTESKMTAAAALAMPPLTAAIATILAVREGDELLNLDIVSLAHALRVACHALDLSDEPGYGYLSPHALLVESCEQMC